MTRDDREWWEAEVAMHKDRAERLERQVRDRQEAANFYESHALAMAALVLRAGVKPKNDYERAAVAWAQQRPEVQLQLKKFARSDPLPSKANTTDEAKAA